MKKFNEQKLKDQSNIEADVYSKDYRKWSNLHTVEQLIYFNCNSYSDKPNGLENFMAEIWCQAGAE